MKYKYKIALLFTLICTLIMGGFSTIIYVLVIQHNQQQFQSRLEERAILAGQVLLEKDELSSSQYNKIVEKQLRKLPQEIHYILRIEDDGTIPVELLPIQLQSMEQISSLQEHLDIVYETINEQEVAYLFYEDNEGSHIVIITAQDKDGDEDLAFIQNILIFLTLFTFCVIGGISLGFANKIIDPVKKISAQVQKINISNLSQRLEVKENQDQLYYLSISLNKLLDRLESSFEHQKQFIENASHELRTPLTVILAEVEIAQKKNNLSLEEKISIEKILLHANKLNQILEALMDLSFIEKSGDLAMEVIRFDEAVQEVVDYFFKTYLNAKINIHYTNQEIGEQYLECKANKIWLAIVVQNILSNAYKFSNAKPINITIEDFNKCVEITVIDEGLGIEEDDLTKIKEPFYRGKNIQHISGKGTGLSLCYKIMELMGGEINIDSKLGKGTSVKLKLYK